MHVDLSDRLTREFTAGLLGRVAMIVPDYILFLERFSHLRYLEWAGAVIYGHRPDTLAEAVFAEAAHLFFAGMVSIPVAYLISSSTSVNLSFKGWFYGVAVWFGLFALSALYKIPGIGKIPLGSAVSNCLGASVYGLVSAAALAWLERRVGV